MIVIGIDPGLDGALVALVRGSDATITVLDTPTLTVQGPKGNKREYNLASMSEMVRSLAVPGTRAFVEKVHSMPGQGVRSMFSMGVGLGAWLGILAGLQIPYELVTPQRWKKALLPDMGKDKDASRLRAIQLFPAHANLFARKKDDGRADAMLIAEYGRRQHV